MARFGDPAHLPHMHAGVRKALLSPRTPAHLKPHLAARLEKTMQKCATCGQTLPKKGMMQNDHDGDEMSKPNVGPKKAPMKPKKLGAFGNKKPNPFFGEK